MFFRSKVLASALLVPALLDASAGRAATATTAFPVTATVVKACQVNASPLAFGNYDPTSAAALNGTTTLTVLCTVGSSFTVGLNAGTATGATVATRKMSNGGNTLSYALYQDAGRGDNWGNTPGTDTPDAITAATTPTNMTVYGQVPAGQNVPAGDYSDTITVTVTY